MSKFDLRKYIPLLGAMGYLNEPPKNNEIKVKLKLGIEIQENKNLKLILDDIIHKYKIEHQDNLFEILKGYLNSDVKKFLEIWKYILEKYQVIIYDSKELSDTIINWILNDIVYLYDDNNYNYNEICSNMQKDKQLQKVIFSTPYLDNCDIDRFIISIFDDYEDKKFFDEIFNYIYSNRERYKDYNFYQTIARIIDGDFMILSTEKLNRLKEFLKDKNVSQILCQSFEKAYKECAEDEELMRKVNEDDDETIKSEKTEKEESTIVSVVGINYENRKESVDKLRINDNVYLVREKENQYDKNAISVVNKENRKLGYVEKERAKEIAPILDKERKNEVIVIGIYNNVLKIKINWL